jgi:hypothetical protein
MHAVHQNLLAAGILVPLKPLKYLTTLSSQVIFKEFQLLRGLVCDSRAVAVRQKAGLLPEANSHHTTEESCSMHPQVQRRQQPGKDITSPIAALTACAALLRMTFTSVP